jgi:two-component sensor histidine kinase/Tfp pilus assembly protein PilF
MTCVFTIVTIILGFNPNHVLGKTYSLPDEDSVKLVKAQEYIVKKQYDSASTCLHQVLSNPKFKAPATHWLGTLHASADNLDSAIIYFQKAMENSLEIGHGKGVAAAELNLGIAYKTRGLYALALTHSHHAVKYFDRQPPSRELASAFNNIAIIYTNTKDFESALLYHRRTLSVRRTLNLQYLAAHSLNNIGKTFVDMNNLDSAVFYFTESLTIKREQNENTASTLNNLGEAHLKLGKPEAAIHFLEESLRIKHAKSDKAGQAITLKNLGHVYLILGKFRSAAFYLDEGEAFAREVNSLEYLRDIVDLQSQLNEKTGNMKRALAYNRELIAVKDSLLNKEKAQIIGELQIRFETEKKEQQILLMQREDQLQVANLQQKNTLIIALIAGIALVAAIVVLLWINSRSARQGKERVEMLMQELQHRIRNNLQLLSSIFTLQTKNLTDASTIALAKGSEGRVNAIAMIHRELSGDGTATQVAMDHYVRELVEALKNAYRQDSAELLLQFELEKLNLDVDKAMPLGLIINELVTNSFKYAFPGTTDPKLRVAMRMENTGSLLLQVSDNGHQVKDVSYYESNTSFGLNMVRTLVRELHGKLEIHLQNGTHFHLHIPIAA